MYCPLVVRKRFGKDHTENQGFNIYNPVDLTQMLSSSQAIPVFRLQFKLLELGHLKTALAT